MSDHQYPDGMDELDFWHASFPKCPYCGYEHQDEIWDCWPRGLDDDGDKTEYDCTHCKKVFIVTLHIEHEFTSKPAEKASK